MSKRSVVSRETFRIQHLQPGQGITGVIHQNFWLLFPESRLALHPLRASSRHSSRHSILLFVRGDTYFVLCSFHGHYIHCPTRLYCKNPSLNLREDLLELWAIIIPLNMWNQKPL
ncbi:hypothetical protein WAI453_000932 [Rhynchosporium graminicola]